MIRQKYQECPAYRGNSFLKAICKDLDSFRKIASIVDGILTELLYIVKRVFGFRQAKIWLFPKKQVQLLV